MRLFTYDRVDTELLKHLYETMGKSYPDVNADSGHVLAACAQHPTMQLVSKRLVPSLRVKSRDWVIKVQTDNGRITNFAATRNLDAVWARPKDRQYIIGASSEQAFAEFIEKHYDVMVYYFAALDPETEKNIGLSRPAFYIVQGTSST